MVLYLHSHTGHSVSSQFNIKAAQQPTDSHVWRAALWRSHPGAFLQPLAKLFIYVDTRIRGSSCQGPKRPTLVTGTISWFWFHFWQLPARVVGKCYGVSLTQREDLPQKNAVRPHVTLGGEHLVKDGLGGHPLERETRLRANQTAGEGLQVDLRECFSPMLHYGLCCNAVLLSW